MTKARIALNKLMILREENNILNTNGGKTPQTPALVIGLPVMLRPAFLSKTLSPPVPFLPSPPPHPRFLNTNNTTNQFSVIKTVKCFQKRMEILFKPKETQPESSSMLNLPLLFSTQSEY